MAFNKQNAGGEATKERKELNQSTCYVVVEDDRGMGSTVEAVYADKVEANKHAASSSHLYVEESIFYSHNDLVHPSE